MIFTRSLQKVDEQNPQDAIKKMVSHIKYIQEQLEFTLHNLDSSHITEIDTAITPIKDSSGSASIGSFINLTGANGESFSVGKNNIGQFEFAINGKDGKQTMYLNSSGELIITENTSLTVNGGTW